MPYIMENGRLYKTEDADSGIRYDGQPSSFSQTSNFVVSSTPFVPIGKDARCRYCNTMAFEGERRCVACGAPL